jgi:hypothetical protein
MDSIIEGYVNSEGGDYGGQVDWVTQGDLDESVEKVVFSLPLESNQSGCGDTLRISPFSSAGKTRGGREKLSRGHTGD